MKIINTEKCFRLKKQFSRNLPPKLLLLPRTRREQQIQDDDWFCITNAGSKDYSIDLLSESFSTCGYGLPYPCGVWQIDYLFVVDDRFIYFQMFPSQIGIAEKNVHFGEEFTYKTNCAEIVIKDLPDAIYDKNTDNLYFRRLESITSIFRGIDMLYREATQEETDTFLGK